MADKPEELARRGYDAWNARDIDTLLDLTHPDCTLTMVGTGEVLRGKEGARQYAQMWIDAFPDGKTTVDNVFVSGDTAIVESTGRGTHTGTLVGPAGSIPATGKSVTLTFCELQQYRDGKMIASRTYLDSAQLLTQLGVMPAPQQAQR